MTYFSSTYRSKEPEFMDEFDLQGVEMERVLTDLKNVNRLLGGNKVTRKGIAYLLKNAPKNKVYTLIDIGCGDGEMLRQCARFGKYNGYNFQLIGIDANGYILKEARKRSSNFSNIQYLNNDLFSSTTTLPECDIALCTLFLHHFEEAKIIQLLTKLSEVSKVGVVVNDLQRSRLSFVLFSVVRHFLLRTKTARNDGLVSIARGFKRKELELLSEKIPKQTSRIRWKWAFRYQWILKTIN